ncbi:hypothetical protein [Microbacterium sp. MYb64]|uniref:hypothetical protein n=1 Tax=Microbacterium sp. MYb64 TaxID=1848691 RepID=UPI000CFE3461|nr:hypothetical protein [Microbacterium sp. MYb64]PRB04278.1 hypothetical protein CQ044_11905 [Microbacterium sp. MYb64]
MQQHPPELRHRTSALRRATWRIWPWLTWLLPIGVALFCLWRVATAHGELAFGIVLTSPLTILMAGVLGSLPRLIHPRAGVRATPARQVPVLILLWWSWVAFVIAMPDRTIASAPSESVPVPSLLQQLAGGPAGGVFTSWVFVAAIVCGIAAWILLLMPASDRVAIRHARRWERLGWAGFGLAPLLLATAGGIGVTIGQMQGDAAGEVRAQATARTAEKQIALAEQRYDAVQRVVSDLRAAVAPQGWEAQEACAESLNDDGLGWDAYRLRIAFRHAASLELDHDALTKALTNAGWTVTLDQEAPMAISASGPQGAELRFTTDGDAPFQITATAGSWWQSADQPVSDARCGAHGGAGVGYSGSTGGGADASWWPPLR